MEDNCTMQTLKLLDQLEQLTNEAHTIILSGKIMVDPVEVESLIQAIRLSLPEDIHQAEWVRQQKETMLANAKAEYDRVVKEAEKEAAYLVSENEITVAAKKIAKETLDSAEYNCRLLKLRTYDYVDRMLYDMQVKMDELNMKYFGEMYTNLEHTFQDVAQTLSSNRDEIRKLASKTQAEGTPQGENK